MAGFRVVRDPGRTGNRTADRFPQADFPVLSLRDEWIGDLPLIAGS